MTYIDVSEWQGIIEWEKVKPHIDGAILRAGYGKNHADKRFSYNAAECNRLNIPIGAYWFSYAKSADEAKAEAKYLLDAVKPYRMELPLCYDFEYDSIDNCVAQGVKVTKELATSFASAFLSEIERGGYWALNYANQDYLNRIYDGKLTERFGLWLAAWKLSKNIATPPRTCNIWQWGKGNIAGIVGNVDMNKSYVDFPQAIRKAGLNHLSIDPTSDALKWAQSYKFTDDPALANALWRYHNTFHVQEDAKTNSGLLS